ncbi:MAG: hypothetical protein A2283_02320 [Lentisphaerae bacterium RIFOXYA12_FULL_48_11]|nr:MAG: hypothetical protein A2283_02320 [Lentisphaerae bacterium RIFOXYA12_FULL_48_11]
MIRRTVLSCVAVLVFCLFGSSARSEVFKDGEVVCFLGDSITHGGRYHGMIYDYYLTRFPNRTIKFVNAGVSGDSAGGALNRLEEDVISKKPTSVAIMLGMNDVGRGNYVADPDEKRKAAQKGALINYKANMEKLSARIRAEAGEPKLLFITPSPFDQTCVNDRGNNQPGCNDGLGRCAEIVRELAEKNKGTLVDFHGPMTAFNLEHQKQDNKFTIVGPDRVHPGLPGHLMMAWLFLKTQGAPAVVSKVVVDAAAGKAVECVNAEVTAVTKNEKVLSFTVLEKALPFPVVSGARTVMEFLPIEKDLNQEILQFTGLAEGAYELKIDDAPAGSFLSAMLGQGINLAFNDACPQYKHAQNVAELNEKRRSTETQVRNLLSVRRYMKNHHKIDPDDPAAVQAHYDKMTDKKSYGAVMTLNYIKNWQRYGEFVQQVSEFEQQVHANRNPVPHTYTLSFVPPVAGKK